MRNTELETDDLERAIRAELEDEVSSPIRGKSKSKSPLGSPSLQDNQDSIFSAGEFQIPTIEDSEPVAQLTYTAFLDLRKKAQTVKYFCAVDFLVSLYSLIWRKAWYTGMGVVLCLFGLWGAHTFQRNWITVYLIYLLLDIFLEMIYVAKYEEFLMVIVLAILIMGIRAVTGIIVFQFYKQVPPEGAKAFTDYTKGDTTSIPMTNM